MHISNEHYAQYNNYLVINNSEPGQSVLDLISCKPFYVNVHCLHNTVVYGQIINRELREQRLTFRKAIDLDVVELSLSAVRYIALSLPVLPSEHTVIAQQQHTGYRVTLVDDTDLVGIAKMIFNDRDGTNIWQMNPGYTIRHLFIPNQALKHQSYNRPDYNRPSVE